jgi:hypothetical protein
VFYQEKAQEIGISVFDFVIKLGVIHTGAYDFFGRNAQDFFLKDLTNKIKPYYTP